MNDLRPAPRRPRSGRQSSNSTPLTRRPRARSLGGAPAPSRQPASAPALQPDKRPAPRQRFPWRIALVLALALTAAILALTTERGRLQRLEQQREEAAAEYQRLVARHTVNETRPWIEKYALENGIEPAYAAAVILRESSYDPKAVSSVGARGLMQLMPDTFEQVRLNLRESTTFEDMFDPETNIRYGCWYLGYLSRIFDGDPIEMACAYHAGPNNVKLWIMNYAADGEHLQLAEIPMEDTRYYAGKVCDAYSIYFQHYYPDPV